MATRLQKKLAKAIVENAGESRALQSKELLLNVGYAESVATHKPQEILEGKGVREELAALGFTTENAKLVVGQILMDEEVEPNARLKAGDMVFKVQGDYAPIKTANININTDPTEVARYKTLKDKYELELFEAYEKTK